MFASLTSTGKGGGLYIEYKGTTNFRRFSTVSFFDCVPGDDTVTVKDGDYMFVVTSGDYLTKVTTNLLDMNVLYYDSLANQFCGYQPTGSGDAVDLSLYFLLEMNFILNMVDLMIILVRI